jgi:hypothetical protein
MLSNYSIYKLFWYDRSHLYFWKNCLRIQLKRKFPQIFANVFTKNRAICNFWRSKLHSKTRKVVHFDISKIREKFRDFFEQIFVKSVHFLSQMFQFFAKWHHEFRFYPIWNSAIWREKLSSAERCSGVDRRFWK